VCVVPVLVVFIHRHLMPWWMTVKKLAVWLSSLYGCWPSSILRSRLGGGGGGGGGKEKEGESRERAPVKSPVPPPNWLPRFWLKKKTQITHIVAI